MGQGIPASLNMMTVALGIFVITYFLSHFGQEAVAAYGVATRIEQLVLLPTIGLNTAVLTLAAQNGGAGLYGRVRQTVRKALIYGGFMTAGGSVLLFFGGRIPDEAVHRRRPRWWPPAPITCGSRRSSSTPTSSCS